MERLLNKQFEKLVARTQLILLAERLWPFAVAILCLIGLFLIASFLGLWLVLPNGLRFAGIALFWLAGLYLVFKMAFAGWPSRTQALQRLDQQAIRPGLASAYDDRAVADSGPGSEVFAEHKRRLGRLIAHMRAPIARLDVAGRDPYALRAAIVLGVVATGFLAGGERELRLRAAMEGAAALPPPVPARLDAWLTPPAYTGLDPQILIGEKAAPKSGLIAAPVGSVLHISGLGVGKLKLDIPAGLQVMAAQDNERSFSVMADASLAVPTQAGPQQLAFHAIVDKAPTITLDLPLEPVKRGTQVLKFKTEDDYGLKTGSIEITALDPAQRVLVPVPKLPLLLPPKRGIGEGKTTLDLGDSPWAGAKAILRLSVTDDAQQTGQSEPVELKLPQKTYRQPLARALIEQRRELMLSPDTRLAHVEQSLKALLIAPDEFAVPASAFLGMTTALKRLKAARSDEELVAVGALLLDVAQGVENAVGSDRQLQAAKDALREAIKNGASPEEIARLMKDLRAALDKALKEAGKKPLPQAQSKPMEKQDLQSLLDKLEDAAKSGDEAEAQALLDMLDTLTAVASGEGGQDSESSMLDEMQNQLDDLSRGQQSLRDRTYSQGQPREEADGQMQGEGQDLQQSQSELRRKLQDLKRKLDENGVPGDGMGAADDAMKQAEDALGKGKKELGQALDAQGKALEALRKEAQKLAEQGDGQGKGGKGGKSANRRDPLGRNEDDDSGEGARGDGGRDAKATAAVRARRILNEIQKRLSEAARPAEEKSYLDRLLRNF